MTNTPSVPKAIIDETLRRKIGELRAEIRHTVYVVLDDDPTGTQTAYDVPVITRWDVQSLVDQLLKGAQLFFILTNSRSLPEPDAVALGEEIGRNLKVASEKTAKSIQIISRGDSTLRGHYPAEVDAFYKGFGAEPGLNLLIPAFFEGGRYTLDDVHYLEEGGKLVPVGESPFAQDKSFGYQSSNLKDWVVEKSRGSIAPEDVLSVPNELLECQREEQLDALLQTMQPHQVLVVNAANYKQLDFFTYCLLKSGRTVNVRSSASFVASMMGVPPKPLLAHQELTNPAGRGGLIVVGSYVPKTTAQLDYLKEHSQIQRLVIDVGQVLNDDGNYQQATLNEVRKQLQADQDLVLYTSRKLMTGAGMAKNLEIGQRISQFLVAVVKGIEQVPRFIMAKGGITSSDVATKALGIREARVMGQILPGVPVWQMAPTSKFPNTAYVIFPGNVGDDKALYDAYSKLKTTDL